MSITIDRVDLTDFTESSPRTMAVDTLQIHHATAYTYSQVRSLMAPGGRTVSANFILDTDGTLTLVVPLNRRAFTSASAYDHRSITVETVNTSGDPNWGISDASHQRLARLASDMNATYGMALNRARIIGHNETPGSYATACPGPSMDLNRITAQAQRIAAGGSVEEPEDGDEDMGNMYYANGPTFSKDGVTVADQSMWWQRTIGGPLFAITDNKGYLGTAGEVEYLAFAADKKTANFRTVSPEAVHRLIKARGVTTNPEAPVGTVNVGDINVPADPELLATLKALLTHLGG